MSTVIRLCLLATVSLLAACANRNTVSEKSRPAGKTVSMSVEDPYLWLEETDGAKAMDWVKARNAETVSKYANSADFATMRDQILEVMDSKEKIPFVQKMGPYWYNFWRDKDHARGLWRRTTLDEYRKDNPKWETVIDLDALAAAEKENWCGMAANACVRITPIA